jgi:tetratricopeptide (TPR) repeat protein
MPRRLSVVVLAAALLATMGSPVRAEEIEGTRALARGREALAQRDYTGAIEHLRTAVHTLQSDGMALGDAWLQLGIAYLKGQGDSAMALRAFLQSAAVAPDPSTAWLWAGMAAEKLGHPDEAAAFRQRALPPAPAPAPPPPAPAVTEKPAPPAETPAPAPQPQPQPKPAEAAPAEKPDAVQHFFGEAEPEKKPEKAKAEDKDAQDNKDKKDGKKVDAIDHFFGGQKPPQDQAEPEKPPV